MCVKEAARRLTRQSGLLYITERLGQAKKHTHTHTHTHKHTHTYTHTQTHTHTHTHTWGFQVSFRRHNFPYDALEP